MDCNLVVNAKGPQHRSECVGKVLTGMGLEKSDEQRSGIPIPGTYSVHLNHVKYES
jgi:hypothetical protein